MHHQTQLRSHSLRPLHWFCLTCVLYQLSCMLTRPGLMTKSSRMSCNAAALKRYRLFTTATLPDPSHCGSSKTGCARQPVCDSLAAADMFSVWRLVFYLYIAYHGGPSLRQLYGHCFRWAPPARLGTRFYLHFTSCSCPPYYSVRDVACAYLGPAAAFPNATCAYLGLAAAFPNTDLSCYLRPARQIWVTLCR